MALHLSKISEQEMEDLLDEVFKKVFGDRWRINMEIAMTDQNVIELVHETLMVGTVRPKKVPKGNKKQWRWRCTFRDCLSVCKLLWPHVVVKLHDIEKVIDHYEPNIQSLDDNVVDMQWYKQWIGSKNV